ncbi:MAG: DUF6746 family protein [Roseovarius sp.]|nr:DUF6746 family protein [Roseovarius sp.]
MKNGIQIVTTCVAIAVGGSPFAHAEEQIDHYAAEPSETLAAAMDNFVTYNRKMKAVLERDPLTVQDMEEIHQLTYTIEVALARINEELGALPVVLERVHLTSEGDNPAALKGAAAVYLEQADLLDR